MKKVKNEAEWIDIVTHGTKWDRFVDMLSVPGNFIRIAVFSMLSFVTGILSTFALFIGKLCSILWIPAIYYAFKTYGAYKDGLGLFYGGYLKITVCFFVFPFIAVFVAAGLRMLREFFYYHSV